jgi:SAM-dependent methyltransferase
MRIGEIFEMSVTHSSFRRPGPFGIFKDFVNRAIHGELDLPPWWLRDVGGGDFMAIGQEFLSYFIELAMLQPDEQVLDIGCGSGRMAIPLTRYLSREGSYTGIDIVEDSIGWCQQHISPRYPNFTFLHADLYNKRYNPGGQYLTREYIFPFQDNSYDFIFLTSVLTHLLPADVEHYLREIARLLRSQGRAFITLFLLNEVQQSLKEQGRNDINFQYRLGSYSVRDEVIPESAVAYDESFVYDLLNQTGLVISPPIHYGHWSGRENGMSHQDVLLVRPVRD